jgi:hypothetical protein
MLRKAATELRIAEGHRFGLSVSSVILTIKTYLLCSYILNTLISDAYFTALSLKDILIADSNYATDSIQRSAS